MGAVGLAWFLVLGGGFIAWNVVAVPLSREILDNDLTLAYIGARIGIEHGWTHLYSLSLQHQLFEQLRPSAPFNDGERFISPPPSAWVLVPLTVLGAAATVYVWLVASVAALVAAWWIAAPGSSRARALWLIAALAWYPVQYSLSLAQPDLIVLLAALACWKLADKGRPYLAGAVLDRPVQDVWDAATADEGRLMADIFRREGCEVWTDDGPDADVIDLEVTRGGMRVLVNFQLRGMTLIGIAPVVEMASVGQRVHADEVFIVTDGDFTPEAVAIAPAHGVVLIDGRALINLVLRFTYRDPKLTPPLRMTAT